MSLRTRPLAAAGPAGAAVLGGLATDPDSRWFQNLDKPSWYPPPQVFGIVWTGLYAGTAWAAGEVLERAAPDRARSFTRAYAANLVLSAAGRRCSSGPTGRGWPPPRARRSPCRPPTWCDGPPR